MNNNEILYTDEDFKTIRQLMEEGPWPPEYNSVAGLLPYIRRQGENIQGIEVGTERGESAYLILEKCKNVSKLYTIDHYQQYNNWNGFVPKSAQKKFEEIAEANLEKFNDRVKIVKLPSITAASGFEPESMDFIYIDGDSSEEMTYTDLKNYYPLLKINGLFCGHNYQFQTVNEGLKRFREEYKIRIPLQRSSNGTYFWVKK